jgi:PAS domain-containing protein
VVSRADNLLAGMPKTYINSIIDSVQNAVWIVEVDPRAPDDPSAAHVIHVNPAAVALFHCPCSALIGSSLIALVQPVAADGIEWWRTVASGQRVSGIELDLIGPNRVEVPVMLVASGLPSRHGKCRHVVCVAQDMTHRRLAAHLVRENDRLVDEITALRNLLRELLPGWVPDEQSPS